MATAKTPVGAANPDPHKRYTIEIPEGSGKKYSVRVPKTAIVMMSTQRGDDIAGFISDVRNIIKMMFTEKDQEVINKRLWEDPDDDLDTKDIFKAIEDVTEAATGNPTS